MFGISLTLVVIPGYETTKEVTHAAHDFDIGGAGPITRRNGVNDPEDIALHHADVVWLVVALGHVTQVLDEVHNVGTGVHGVALQLL
jgi:hypothetical protein